MGPPRRYVDGMLADALLDSTDDSGADDEVVCDSCGKPIEGKPAGAGLFLWTRGDEVRYEEPPLCEKCARAIALGAPPDDSDEEL